MDVIYAYVRFISMTSYISLHVYVFEIDRYWFDSVNIISLCVHYQTIH